MLGSGKRAGFWSRLVRGIVGIGMWGGRIGIEGGIGEGVWEVGGG